jgi:hypothetical protein
MVTINFFIALIDSARLHIDQFQSMSLYRLDVAYYEYSGMEEIEADGDIFGNVPPRIQR